MEAKEAILSVEINNAIQYKVFKSYVITMERNAVKHDTEWNEKNQRISQ